MENTKTALAAMKEVVRDLSKKYGLSALTFFLCVALPIFIISS